ncbi:MAG TPA: helix-turn-helix transcriptional regulator [Vicinamibacterales bacterium]|nr:helix-turn-helix transcriptional regulator [Vicinamibacterales bacterium]
MRVVLVGSPDERRRLRRALNGSAVEIAGEAASTAAARASGLIADAFLLGSADDLPGVPSEEPDVAAESLTPREVQVLELVAEGLPNKAIAGRLGISDQTVKFHVASICGKLGASNRTDAVRKALQRGLITL